MLLEFDCQFDSAPHLRAWEDSPRRRELLERGDHLSKQERSTFPGLDNWFQIPSQSDSPRWKNFLLTWAAAYPSLLLLSLGLSAVAPQLPRALALAITSGILTALLTWVILPRLNRQARRWLLRGASADPTARPHQRSTG